MQKINIGIIGWGFMGKTHAQALLSLPFFYPKMNFSVKLKCICTRRMEKAKEAMEIAGFERCCDDYRQLLAMDDIDVVSICTPNDSHEEIAIAALKAGKQVYIDKPLAVTGDAALRIARAAEEAGAFTRVAYHYRYYPATLRAKQLIDEGRIGNILQFEARYLHGGSIDPAKPIGWKQQLQGGALLDMGSHVLDLTTHLIGYPERVFCKLRKLYSQRPCKDGQMTDALSDDHALMLLEMKNGAMGVVESSKIASGSNDDLIIEIRGDRGAVRWSLMEPNYLEFYDMNAKGAPIGGERGFTRIETVGRFPCNGEAFIPKNTVGWERGHMHCYYSFLNSIAKGERPTGGIDEGARLQCLMDKMFESDRLGQWLDLDEGTVC